MRIEMPASPWDTVHRAQEDAHTLTLPLPRGPAIPVLLLPGAHDAPLPRQQVCVAEGAAPRIVLTITF